MSGLIPPPLYFLYHGPKDFFSLSLKFKKLNLRLFPMLSFLGQFFFFPFFPVGVVFSKWSVPLQYINSRVFFVLFCVHLKKAFWVVFLTYFHFHCFDFIFQILQLYHLDICCLSTRMCYLGNQLFLSDPLKLFFLKFYMILFLCAELFWEAFICVFVAMNYICSLLLITIEIVGLLTFCLIIVNSEPFPRRYGALWNHIYTKGPSEQTDGCHRRAWFRGWVKKMKRLRSTNCHL